MWQRHNEDRRYIANGEIGSENKSWGGCSRGREWREWREWKEKKRLEAANASALEAQQPGANVSERMGPVPAPPASPAQSAATPAQALPQYDHTLDWHSDRIRDIGKQAGDTVRQFSVHVLACA